ncbi:hypothetical protein BDZ89DRAFT_1147674 [Hymenopellis radicata]|nr:hypothetical protein BDZ89DRAFT_1147674 [Hymenopellis radicata]
MSNDKSGSSMDTETEDPVYHDPEFQAPDADVCIVSSDDILFRVHSTNLRVHSSIFPVVSGSSINLDDPVRMSERGDVLRVVFKYIYPEPPLPNLGMLPFRTLEEVATTADKYQFLALMQLCDRYMEDHAEAHPAALLKYAYLRNEDAMLDRIAPHTISLEVFDAAQQFDSVLFKRWAS